jgi:putative transposase
MTGKSLMLLGIRLKANPTKEQKLILSQWMGCARNIWNAKCDEESYYSTFARKYCPIGTYAPIDQTTAQFKNKELSPWLYHCPSQIIRNSAANWYQTFVKFMKGQCGKPKRKSKTDKGSIHLTRELFSFEVCEDGVLRLFVGSKKNNIGYLSFKTHRKFQLPNSIYIRKECGQYYVSFCYEASSDKITTTDKAHLDYLKSASTEFLEAHVVGIDRGVVIPVQAGNTSFDFSDEQKKKKEKTQRYIKRLQRKLARQKKGAKRRQRTKHRLARHHRKMRNIRQDFSHKTSRAIVNSQAKVIIFEDLKTANMTKQPKSKQNAAGIYLPNQASAKAGLNKAILDKGWHQLEVFTKYKAVNAGKAVFKIPAHYTSQECASCGHTHPDNRKSQALFICGHCGNVDNADQNASLVIKKRAIRLIQDSGTELSDKGVLILSDTGRGASCQSGKPHRKPASSVETSKKNRTATTHVAA